jgi:TrmH family RNA methyltransferase
MLTKSEITRVQSLQRKRDREELGLFAIEGEKAVAELLAAKFPFETIYATSSWRAPAGVAFTAVSAPEMARLSHYPAPSSVLALVRLRRDPFTPAMLADGLTLALDGVRDPGNLGTLLRIADWFGLDRVVCSPDCADRFSQKVINASVGSFGRVPVFEADLAGALAGQSIPVFGADLAGESVHAMAAPPAAVIVIGSEGPGLSAAVRQRVTHYVTIPKYGAAESLNAAVAAAVICDNLLRNRRG